MKGSQRSEGIPSPRMRALIAFVIVVVMSLFAGIEEALPRQAAILYGLGYVTASAVAIESSGYEIIHSKGVLTKIMHGAVITVVLLTYLPLIW